MDTVQELEKARALTPPAMSSHEERPSAQLLHLIFDSFILSRAISGRGKPRHRR